MRSILQTFGIVILLACAQSALADPSPPLYGVAISGNGYGHGDVRGGTFTATPQSGLADWDALGVSGAFQTFCGEANVLGFGNYATIDDEIYFAKTGGGVALSSELKNVLARWFLGGFSAIGITSGTDLYRNTLLQAYIWNQLGQSMPNAAWSAFYSANSTEIQAIGDDFGGAIAAADRVKVLNLWDTNDVNQLNSAHDKQSQFVFIPIPVPGAVLLGAIGLASIGLVRWLRLGK